MLRIIICEDNAEYLNLLEDYVNHTLESGNIAGEVVCAATHPDEVESYLTQGDANVFLFDIDLNSDKNGYELAVKIRENNPEAYLVFISEHLEYVFQSFKVRPFDFLPKPVTMKRLSLCMESIWKDHCRKNTAKDAEDIAQIKFGTNIHFIKKSEIVYIASYGNKLEIKTLDGILYCYEPLKTFEKKLEGNKIFIRCHKSFIVNSLYIREIRLKEMEVLMSTGDICFIGKKYKNKLLESFKS